MKIAILLPSKENYSNLGTGAVKLLVNSHLAYSKYKKNIKIYGHKVDKPLNPKNFVSLNKNNFFFNNRSYLISFVKIVEKDIDLIEIHNRPNYFIYLHKKFPWKKFVLFFHNDTNTLQGSMSDTDKKYIINNCNKIIFLSEYIKNTFISNMDEKNSEKFQVFYPGIKKINKFPKKQKIVIFVGKLNKDKGYDIYQDGVENFLKKFPEWKSFSIGFEKRRNIPLSPYTKELGEITNRKVLNIYSKASVAVANSVREEPLGRLPIEAASRGCLPIISSKGGLPETIKDAIILKKNTSDQIFLELLKIAKNKEKTQKMQNKIFKNFKYNVSTQAKKLDIIRDFFIKKTNFKHLKIIHVTNLNIRFAGRLQYNTSNRLNNGFIRLGHNVLNISDRDFLHFNKNPFNLSPAKNLNELIIETHKNFKADLIVFGHADSVNLETLIELKKIHGVNMCQWFLDPLVTKGPDFDKNFKRISKLDSHLDCTFLTTSPDALNFKLKNPYYIPNPSDPSFETMSAYKYNNTKDVFFAMSHGVHRGRLKFGKFDEREIFLKKLKKKCANIKFDFYGFDNIQPVWGDKFLERIVNSSMAINLSRGKPIKYYSSDRIAQLMGNGLLTFIDSKILYSNFFNKNELITYKNINDLADKIKFYQKNERLRAQIARNGQKKYNKYFDSKTVAHFIIEKSFYKKTKNKYLFEK